RSRWPGIGAKTWLPTVGQDSNPVEKPTGLESCPTVGNRFSFSRRPELISSISPGKEVGVMTEVGKKSVRPGIVLLGALLALAGIQAAAPAAGPEPKERHLLYVAA